MSNADMTDTNEELQIVVKKEPNDVVAEDHYHGYIVTLNKDDSDTEDCNYGNMHLVKTEFESTDDNHQGIMGNEDSVHELSSNYLEIKLPLSMPENCKTVDLSSAVCTNEVNSSYHGYTDKLCKHINKRKRKKTIRRNRVENSELHKKNFPDSKSDDYDEQMEIVPIEINCGICNKFFTDTKNFQEHVKTCGNAKNDNLVSLQKTPKTTVSKRKRRKKEITHCKCEICGKSFKNRLRLERHSPVHTGLRPYQCHICERAYTQKGHLQEHMKLHNDSNKTFECEYCFKVSQRKDKYEMHINRHTKSQENRYLCNACGREFGQKTELQSHIMAHRNTELYSIREFTVGLGSADSGKKKRHVELDSFVYVCHLCKKEFKDWFSLQENLCSHMGKDFLLICETCGQKFTTKDQFKKHQEKHSTERSYKCDVCGKYLCSNMDMVTHRHIHVVVACPVRQRASKQFDHQLKIFNIPGESDLQTRSTMRPDSGFVSVQIQSVEKSDSSENLDKNNGIPDRSGQSADTIDASDISGKVDCNVSVEAASDTFKSDLSSNVSMATMQSNIKNAINTSTNYTSYNGAYCGNEKNKVQIKIVGKKKLYECPICGKTFPDRRGIVRHGPVHTGIRAFKCTICGRSYKQKVHLGVHLKKHHTDTFFERFECAFCLQVFEKKTRYIQHKVKHNSQYPYTCNVCNTCVLTVDQLYAHFKTHKHHHFYYVKCNPEIRNLDANKKCLEDKVRIDSAEPQADMSYQSSQDKSLPVVPEKSLLFENELIYTCLICKKKKQKWKILLEHLDGHFGMTKKFQCETCDEILSSADDLEEHTLRHKVEFEQMCPVCFKFFTLEEDLIKHFNVHGRKAVYTREAKHIADQSFINGKGAVVSEAGLK